VPSTQRVLRLPVSVLAAAAGMGFVLPSPAPAATAHSSSGDAVSTAVAQRINAQRAQHGLRPLVLDGRLFGSARSQSSAMMARRALSHGNPNGVARLTRLCRRVHARTVGETIGWIRYRGSGAQAEGIVRWWMNSPPHRAALMSPSFSRIGVGRRIGSFGGHRVVWFTADLAG
jgi:uncharacterized protein YkwD